jgi:hypothetical protein
MTVSHCVRVVEYGEWLLYGDFLNFNSHLHAIVADGGFVDDNSFRVAPQFVGKNLEKAFQYEVLKMLKIGLIKGRP